MRDNVGYVRALSNLLTAKKMGILNVRVNPKLFSDPWIYGSPWKRRPPLKKGAIKALRDCHPYIKHKDLDLGRLEESDQMRTIEENSVPAPDEEMASADARMPVDAMVCRASDGVTATASTRAPSDAASTM